MVNSESVDSTGDGKPKEYITQLNSGGGAGISVDTHSPSPVTASSVRLRDMDFDVNESAADVTSAECANPMDSLPETAVTRSIDEENFRLTNIVTSQTDSEVSSLYCSVPLNKVQDVLCSYSADSPTSSAVSDAKDKKLLPRRLLCLYCDRTFVTSNLRQKHVDRCHSVKQARRSSSRFQTKFTTGCIFCKKLNNTDHNLNDLFKHLVEKHSNKYFACATCKERFVLKTHLDEHNFQYHEQKEETVEEEASGFNGVIPSQNYPAENSSEVNTVKTKHKTKLKKYSEFDGEDVTMNRPNLRMGVRKELRKKKVGVKSTKAGVKRNTRLQTKVSNAQTKSTGRKRTKPRNEKSLDLSEKSSASVNPYPTFDAYFRVKKITDHSIDNLKISSLTFDDVFDKAFYTRIKCNIQENLQNHIDGKLFNNEESESRISNFEKNQELNISPAENFGCDISLNAATPVVSLLSSQLGEDLESQIEYGAKASKKKPPPKQDEVHYKYFTRRKYQASILENKENRDLSKLDMWTQLVVKDRQQKIINDKKTEKEKLEYAKGIEYRTKMQNLELNRILDRRGPFEDLKEEANKKAALEKYNRLGENVSCEAISDVSSILNDLIERAFDFQENSIKNEEDDRTADQMKLQIDDRDCELPFYLNLRRNSSLIDQPDIDKSDRITLICSSQETENYEESATPRDKNALVELSGEWTRTRIYICAACGVKVPNIKYLLDHKGIYHQNVWVQHYEFVGNQSVLYKHLSIPGLGKVGFVEEYPMSKSWRRSDARLCTKCSKMCNTLGELHRHILECGEDWSWMLARKKLKYRPFGTKSRRKRRGLVKRIIHKEKSGDEVREKRKYNVKRYDGPRPKPSDAETIQRMLANLPAKRATRKLISLKDGFPKQVRRKPSQKSQNTPTNSAKNGVTKQKTSVSSLQNQALKANNRKNKGLKCNSMILRKSVRNINKVFSSKILDSNSTLLVKRKIKNVLQHQRITRAKKVLMEEPSEEKVDEASSKSTKKGSVISKVKMLTRAVKKTVMKKDENKNDSNDNSTSVNNSASASKPSSTRNTRNLKKSDSLEDTIQDIMNSIDTSETRSDNKEVTKFKINAQSSKLDEDSGVKAEITKKKAKLVKKESVSTKLMRTLSLRKLRKKNTQAAKLKTQSNPELDVKDNKNKSKNGKRKSTLDSFRSKIKKMKLKEKSIMQIVQIDGSSQISDEILPFLEKININSDEHQEKNVLDNDQNTDEDPLGDSNYKSADIILNDKLLEEEPVALNPIENNNSDNNIIVANHILPIDTQVNENIETSANDANNMTENLHTTVDDTQVYNNNHLISESVPTDTSSEYEHCSESKISIEENNYEESKEMIESDAPIDLRCPSVNKSKIKKRSKGLNDCIAMLTSKLQQKTDEDQPVNTDDVSKASTIEAAPVPVADEPILKQAEEKEAPKIENNKQEQKHDKKTAYPFPQIPFLDYFTQQNLVEINRKLIDRDHIEKQRQELFNIQARFVAEQQQLLLQQLQKQIPTNHQYGYIPNIPRETNFLINNIMLNGQNDFAQKLLNQNDNNLSKFIGNFDRNNRFKEVDVNIEIDIMKYLGNVADNCVVKLEKLKNKSEGKKKTNNKTAGTRRYNNKRKENIEIMNDLKQQEIINKIMTGRSAENDFVESEDLKQKKLDIFKDNDKVMDLKVKKTEDITLRQPILKLSEGQPKSDLPLRPPTVIEVGQMRSIGFGIVNEVNEAIDLKVKKDAEREKQANLLQQLSKNGVSIALFPCAPTNSNKFEIFSGKNEIIDLKIKKKNDLVSKIQPPKSVEEQNKNFTSHINDRANLHGNEEAIDLKIKERVKTTEKYLQVLDGERKTRTDIPSAVCKHKLTESNFAKQVLPKTVEEPFKAVLIPHLLETAQITQLTNIFTGNCIPADIKCAKKVEKKKRIPKPLKHNIEIIPICQPNQEQKLLIDRMQSRNNEVINLKINKATNSKEKELKALNDLKSTFPQFGQIDLKLFETLNNSLVDGLKTKAKITKNHKIKDTPRNIPDKNVNSLPTTQNHVKAECKEVLDKNVNKEKKKIILKPPQFIAVSLEKIHTFENPVLPKVPTIAESLSFSIQEPPPVHTNGFNKSIKKKNGTRTKNLDSIELKIKSLLLDEREPDIMETKPVERACLPRSNSKNRENKVPDKDIVEEGKETDAILQSNLPVSTKSDTDSDDDIPLANLIKENQKKDDVKESVRNNEISTTQPVMSDDINGVISKNSLEDEFLPHLGKDVSFLGMEKNNPLVILEKVSFLPVVEKDTALSSLQENIVLPILEEDIPLSGLEKDISSTILGKDIALPTLEKDTALAILEEDSVLPILETDNTLPTLENDIALPVLDKEIAAPILEEEIAPPILDEDISAPILEKEIDVLIFEKEITAPILEKEIVLPSSGKDITLPILDKNIDSTILEKDMAFPILEKDVSVPIFEKNIPLPLLEKDVTLPILEKHISMPIVEKEISLPIPEKGLPLPLLEQELSLPIIGNEAALPPVSENEPFGANVLGVYDGLMLGSQLNISVPNIELEKDILPGAVDAKTKKVRGRKRISPEEKKEKPKKKTPKSKGTPLYDESDCDPLNKAARKIKISCQIFQKSSKIVLEKTILNETEEDEEEDEETRLKNMTKIIHVPVIIDGPLPDVFIKEELSTEPVPPAVDHTALLKNIKEELPEVEETEAVPATNDDLFSTVPDATPSFSSEDLELEIRRRIKLSNLQLKRENTDDNLAIPTPINPDMIYNVDSPEMPYNTEESDVTNIYEHVIDNVIERPGYDSVDGLETNTIIEATNTIIAKLRSFYPKEDVNLVQDHHAYNYQTGDVFRGNCNLEMEEKTLGLTANPAVISNLTCDVPTNITLPDNIAINTDTSSVIVSGEDVTNSILSTTPNIVDEPSVPLETETLNAVNNTKENDTISACSANIVANHDEENIAEMNFDAEHDKEGDLPTENANTAPNLEVLEEHKQFPKESETKLKKTKKKHEMPTTDIIPSYGEFEVNTNQTAGVNKITISRKKLQVSSESNEAFANLDQNRSSIDVYVVKKVKRSHRKSINSKERKRKKSASLKENQNCENSIIHDQISIPSKEVDENLDLANSFDDNFLDNVEFEVQNEEIGRRLKINKKKVKEIPSVSSMELSITENLVTPIQKEMKADEVIEVPNVEVERIIENKSDEINLDILEEQKDYDDLPKDMEIEEFQVDIPIIETQFKPKFDIPLASIRMSSTFDDLPSDLPINEQSYQTDDKRCSQQLDPTLINEENILGGGQTDEIDDFINQEFQRPFEVDLNKDFDVNTTIGTDERSLELEQINSLSDKVCKDSVFDGSFLNSTELNNLYEICPTQENLTLDLPSISKSESLDQTIVSNMGMVQNVDTNKLDENTKLDVTNDLSNSSSYTGKKNKKSKNPKTSINPIESVELAVDTNISMPLDPIESGLLQYQNNEFEDEAHNHLEVPIKTNPTEIVDNNLLNAVTPNITMDELIIDADGQVADKNPKKSSKKSKEAKNSKKAKSPNLTVLLNASDINSVQLETIDKTGIDLLSNNSAKVKQTNKKSKKAKSSKTAQKNEPSTFEMMCDELQALCDVPLELRPGDVDQPKMKEKKLKEFNASDDDLDFLNATSSSFCDHLKSSCDAKIDELLREISFSPKPSKKSKKSKRSTSKNKNNKVTIDREIDKDFSDLENGVDKRTEDINVESKTIQPDSVTDERVPPVQIDNTELIDKSSELIPDDSSEKVVPNILPAKPKSTKTKPSKKKAAKTKKERSYSVDNAESYCDICDKMFARSENLVKHKRTFTHIAKLSEIEAKEAEEKARKQEEEIAEALEEEQQSYKMDINISDILHNSEKHCDQPDLNNEIANKMHVNSPFVLNTNSDTLKLADIINDVLNKPVENEKHTPYSDSQLSQPPNPVAKGETKRYKSLGERKSFESDLKTTYPFNTMPGNNSDTIQKLPNTNTILKQQISLLENIIETEGPFGFIDDITISSNKSMDEPLTKSPSELSVMSETKQDDSNQLTFTHNSNIMNTLAQQNIHNEPFIRPTQYEEISNDSSSIRNQFDDQRSRKVLNRDEELFLECCSLLKSSSEVSGYSKRSSKTVQLFNNFEMKQSDEPDWLENKSFARKNQEYKHDIFSTCPNTPLGDGYGDDYSNTNSNTIATDWSTKQREQQQENPVFEDISLDSKGSTISKQGMGQFATAESTFGDFQLFNAERLKETEGNLGCRVNNIPHPTVDNINDKEVDEEFKRKMVSRFGGLMAKAWKNSVQAVKKNKNKKKQDSEVTQTSITDYAVPINANAKSDNDLNDSKKMLTKGAMKVFEGLKVSIPTDDLDMKELLNGSHAVKKQEEGEPLIQPIAESELSKEDLKALKTNSMKSFGNRLGLKVTKKKYNLAKFKDPSPVSKTSKTEDDNKKGHDVYDFEETQDNIDIFSSKLTNIKEFRSQIAEKKTLTEVNVAGKEPTQTTEDVEESDGDSGRGVIDSFAFEAQSLSSFSIESSSSLKKPKKKNITKKKCMIMGRIFKNAFKSKIDEDIRDIPSVENSKLVEDYVMQLPQEDEKRTKLTEQEMDMLFDKLLQDKPAAVENINNGQTPVPVPDKLVEKPIQPKSKIKSQPKRKRQRHNSDSTDDEFSLSKNKKRYTKKKQKNDNNAINLEQELKECIGVASRKSQRKCTSGKQNVLVEFWSSDDSNFEAFLKETALDKPNVTEISKIVEEEGKATEAVCISENVEAEKGELNSKQPPRDLESTVKKAITKIEAENQQKITMDSTTNSVNKPEKIANLKQTRRKSTCAKTRVRHENDVEDKKMKNVKVTAETLAANRRKRAASNTLYYWSSSSEDESQDLIEIKPVRDELDEDEDRPMQHGWIVGDSPKKLVTMLAQAKGKKVDTDSVKEQGKKRTTM